MTEDTSENGLREASWRRHLTRAEEAELQSWLAAHPGSRADWEAEQALTEAIIRLPDVPVASNFTARVVEAALRDETRGAKPDANSFLSNWSLRNWLPRIAFALVVGLGGFLSFQQLHRVENEKIARNATLLSEVASVPGADALRDFDAIRALDTSPAADEELLRLMQ